MIYEAKQGDSLLTLPAFGEMLEFEELLQNSDVWNNATHDRTMDQQCSYLRNLFDKLLVSPYPPPYIHLYGKLST